VKRRWHRPGWFAVLLTVAGIAFFCALAAWQVDRAGQKERLFAAFAGASGQPAVALAQGLRQAHAAVYPHVRASGHFDPLHVYLLDDRVRDGRLGVMAYAVFEPENAAKAILVNRGFLPRQAPDRLPDLPALAPGRVTVTGLLAPPPGIGLRIGGNALARQADWPKTTLYIDPAQIGADAGHALAPRVLLLDPAAGSAFVRDWRPQVFPASRHYGYALTWALFALVAAGLFIGMHWHADVSTP
jgi:cytochrome oxidase assembly protein ShyY1